jgi:hypothetical protein
LEEAAVWWLAQQLLRELLPCSLLMLRGSVGIC